MWEAVRVNVAGVEDVMASYSRVFGGPQFLLFDGVTETPVTASYWDGTLEEPLEIVID